MNKNEKPVLKTGGTVLRVFAIIFSVIIALISGLVIFLGVTFGTLSAQFSYDAVEDVVEEIDFYGIVTTVGIDNVLSFVSDKLGFEFFGSTEEFDDNLRLFLESPEFKRSVVSGVARIIGVFGEDSLSFGFGTDELMDIVRLISVPVEKYFGYSMGNAEFKIIETAIKAAGFTGFALAVPLGEIAAEVAIIRFILSDALVWASVIITVILFGLILLLNIKHYRCATVIMGIPLIMGGLMSAGWAATETLLLHTLRVKHELIGTLLLAFTNSARNHLAATAVALVIIGALIALSTFLFDAVRSRFLGNGAEMTKNP